MTPWTIPSMNSPGQNTGVGSLSLLQGIFPSQGSNPGLPHCRWFLYQPQGKPKNTGVGSLSLLQWIFPTEESNHGLLHCRQILYLPSEPPGKPMLVSAVQQSESTICMHLPPPFWISFPFRSAQNTEYSFLCYIVGSH